MKFDKLYNKLINEAGGMWGGTGPTASQVHNVFKGLASGAAIGASQMQKDYAMRIFKGENKDKVLQGLGPNTTKSILDELAKLQAGNTPANNNSLVKQKFEDEFKQKFGISKSDIEKWCDLISDSERSGRYVKDYIEMKMGKMKYDYEKENRNINGYKKFVDLVKGAVNNDKNSYIELEKKTGARATTI